MILYRTTLWRNGVLQWTRYSDNTRRFHAARSTWYRKNDVIAKLESADIPEEAWSLVDHVDNTELE